MHGSEAISPSTALFWLAGSLHSLRCRLQLDKAVGERGAELLARESGTPGLSSCLLIAVSHHAIDPPGSFRCQGWFHNSLIQANLRDKPKGVESVNGAPWCWTPAADSFFTCLPDSLTALHPPLRNQVCINTTDRGLSLWCVRACV